MLTSNLSKQKEIEDNNKQTGKARKSWKYHDDMSECMGRVQRSIRDLRLTLLPLVQVAQTSVTMMVTLILKVFQTSQVMMNEETITREKRKKQSF